LGLELVSKFLLLASFKSGNNLVHETVFDKTDDGWFNIFTGKEFTMTNYYLGIDISKGYADFCILDGNRNPVIRNFQLDDTFEGHCTLYKILKEFMAQYSEAMISAAVESTGGYENNWLKSLDSFQAEMNIRYARLNPYGVHNNSKAALNRLTTDAISAHNVAEYMISHPDKVSFTHEESFATLRKQWKFISALTKQKTQFHNQLGALLYSSYPEILPYCQNTMPQWVVTLLKRYPTTVHVARAKVSTLVRIPHITHARAGELIEAAKKSVASSSDEASAQLITATIKQIQHLQKSIEEQTKKLNRSCSLPEVEILKTFPGIGEFTAIGLTLQIQTIKRFPSVKKISSFFGVHPVFKISGDGSSAFRMSKKGSSEARRLLFMVAFNALRSNPLIREYYHRQLQKGMTKMAAIGACMHKVLRIIYGMLKHEQPFDSSIDRKNSEKTVLRNSGDKKFDANRRYQDFDKNAPVSRRQSRKRGEQKPLPKSANDAECGASTPAPQCLI